MSKKEKFESLFKMDTDRRSVSFHPILMHFAARFNQKTYAQFASDYRILVESNLKALEYFDPDMVGLISDPYRETSAFGAKIEYVEEGVPRCVDLVVKNTDDVKALKSPDLYKSERTLDRIKGAQLYQKLLNGSVPVCGWIEGPLAEACDLAGVTEVLVSLMTDPDFANLLMDKCTITAKEFAAAQIHEGCDIIGIGDAICSQIGLDDYNFYVRDRHKEIIDFIHSLDAKVKLHICGNITHLLPALKNLDIDILDLDWLVDMDEAYHILGDRVVRCGNINPVVIQDKNEDELIQITKDLIHKEKNRRFILSGGCEITVNTPVQNLKCMREASAPC
jgi:MtaA/CmuA family methyltransferase